MAIPGSNLNSSPQEGGRGNEKPEKVTLADEVEEANTRYYNKLNEQKKAAVENTSLGAKASAVTQDRRREWQERFYADKHARASAASKDMRGMTGPLPVDGGGQSPEKFKKNQEKELVIPEHFAGVNGFGHPSETREEKKAELFRAVTEVQAELAKRAGVAEERTAMLEAEGAYLSAYRDFYAKHNTLVRLGKSVLPAKESKKLEELKHAYNLSRSIYAKKLEARAKERLEKEGRKGDEKAVLERYNRLIRFNEIIKPGAELKIKTRVEALGEKEKNIFEKGLGLLSAGNQKFEAWAGTKRNARLYRAAASAVVITGGSAAFGAFGAAGFMAITGYGIFRFGRSFAASGLGAALGEGAGKVYEKYFGRSGQQKAVAELQKRLGEEIAITAEEFDEIDAWRVENINKADEKALANKKNITKALTAMLVGAGTSAFLAELGVFHEVAAAGAHPGDQPNAPLHPRVTLANKTPAPPTASPEQVLPAEQINQSAPSLPPETSATFHVEIDTKGEGVNQLWANLKESLKAKGYALDNPDTPPAVRHILETNINKLSEEYGFLQGGDGVMHQGDSIDVTATKITFTGSHGEALTLGQVDGDGHFSPKELFSGRHRVLERDSVVPAPSGNTTLPLEHGGSESATLNTWALHHPGQTPPPDLLHHGILHTNHGLPQAENGLIGRPLEEWNSAGTKTTLPEGYEPVRAPLPSSHGLIGKPLEEWNSAQPPVVETPFPQVSAFMQTSAWSTYHNADALKLFTADPGSADMPADVQAFRTDLFDVIRQSGLGPIRGESIEAFILRAGNHLKDPSSVIMRPSVVELPDHTFVVRGGDVYARSILGNEYALRVNPSASHVYVETDSKGNAWDFNKRALERGEIQTARISTALPAGNSVF